MRRSKVEVGKLYYRDKKEHMRKEENCNIGGHAVVMELNEERVCEVDRQEEGLADFVLTDSLSRHLSCQREEGASQCPWELVGNLIDCRILDLHWSFEHT